MLLTPLAYTRITGQSIPADFADVQAYVVSRLESILGRALESDERTESGYAGYDGFFYPKATPVVEAEGYEHDGVGIHTGSGYQTVTYTGGYTDETLPAGLAEAIAWGVLTRTTIASGATLPAAGTAGVASLSIAGEYSVTYTAGVVPGVDGYPMPSAWAHAADLGGRCVAAALRYRRLPL